MPGSARSVKLLRPQDLARLLGITRDGIAAAEEAGRLPPAIRTPGLHRRWAPVDVVRHLRARGATVPAELEALASASAA